MLEADNARLGELVANEAFDIDMLKETGEPAPEWKHLVGHRAAIRLGKWNCRLDLDGKRAELERLALDVTVVPESAERPRLALQPDVSHTWTGTNPHKGLGVFGFNGWHVTPLTEVDGYPWCLPVSVRDPNGKGFTLPTIWTVKRQGDGRPSYAAQFTAVIER